MSFLDDLAASLPTGLTLASLRELCDPDAWREAPELAAIQALTEGGIFDGSDYLSRYPDVAEAGVDPVWHFVSHGVAERRSFRLAGDPREVDLPTGLQVGQRVFTPEAEDSVSVIIPAYNVETLLARAVESVLQQTHANLEIIIYEDRSGDGTLAVARDLASVHKVVTLIEGPENLGQGRGRNEAMKLARGNFITFVDADDYYNEPNFLTTMLAELRAHRADMVLSPYYRKREGKISRDDCSTGIFTGMDAAQKFLNREFGTHAPCGKVFRAGLAKSCQFSEHGYSQDTPFVLAALLKSRRVVVPALAGYVYDNDNVSSWRPVEASQEHFYSSLRVLLELTIMAWQADGLNFRTYQRLWRKDHGGRLKKYLADPANLPAAREILGIFAGFSCQIEQMLPEIRFYMPKAGEPRFATLLPPRHAHYVARQIAALKRLMDAMPASEKPGIVIWSEHLAGGGLERVASQFGNVLSYKYDVTYILDKIDQVDYEISGEILPADLFRPEVARALKNAKFIVDFHWKNPKKSFSLCRHALREYAHKYIPTIHNTATCEKYFDVIKEYMDALGKSLAELPLILCVSEAVKDAFVERYGAMSNLRVLHNPVDLAACAVASAIKRSEPYILFCGRLSATEHKGIDLLVEAFAKCQSRDKVKLLMAGSGELEPHIAKSIEAYGLKDRVEIIGFTDRICSYMKGALFTVAPSRWEGFAMTLIESLACGTPVLSSRVGGAAEVIRAGINGALIEPEDTVALSGAIDALMETAPDMQVNCAESVEWLDIGAYGEKIEALLAGVACELAWE